MVEWHAISAATYYAADAASLSDEKLYFLTDTGEIYKGANPFTEACVLYTGTLPTTPARRKIYINTATGEGKIYTGSAWQTVIAPIDASVTSTSTNPVSSKAVAEYVAAQIADVTGSGDLVASVAYTPTGAKLTVTNADGSSSVLTLSSLGASLSYDAATGALSLKDVTGAVLGTAINLDLERFVKSGEYDATNKNVVLYFDDDQTDSVEIPVGDLVDTYTAANSGTIKLTVTNNQFVAEAIASAASGNVLQIKDDGLYVAATDLSNYQTLVASASTTAFPMLNASGQIINGTITPGGAAISATPSASVLATELAVNALVTSTKATIDSSITALTTRVSTLETDVKALQDGKLDAVDVVAPSSTATTGQAADAKATYDALTWKTTL